MARCTVLWHADAVQELAKIWIEAPNRLAVSDAANEIDLELKDQPEAKGRELSEGLRALLEPPLQVLYLVRSDDRLVEVLRVKLI